MATTHYIDTSAPEIARARVKSLTQRVPEAFPVLVYGDTRDHNFVFFNSQTGSVESYSGNASYSLRVTLGEVQLGPVSGSYTLTCGSSGTIDALSDAATIEAALNSLTTVISDGGVKVSGTFPNFLVTYNTVGVKTAFTADATSLVPSSSVSLVVTATGSATVRQQTMIVLRQSAIVSQSTWSTITSPANGWTGTITTATAGALTLLASQGAAVGDFIEVSTCLTAEVLDGSGTPISYYQTPITLRAKNLDPSSSVSPPITGYTLGDILYGKADGTLGLLAGNTSTTTAILTQTGTGVISAIPAWTTTPLSVALGGTGAASLTSTALLLGAGTSAITPADLTYVSPTLSVPDAFTLYSAGSIGLTAGGSNKNVTITPSDSGAQGAVTSRAAYGSQTVVGTGGFQVVKQAVSGSIFPSIELVSYQNGFTAQNFFAIAKAGGTEASPTTATAAATIGAYRGYARANGLWKNIGSITLQTGAGFSDSDFSGNMLLGPATSSGQANAIAMFGTASTGIGFSTAIGGLATNPGNVLTIDRGANVTIAAAWGTSGITLNTVGRTYTDGASSGTVASAVGNSFGIPTFAASSSTTFTNAANVYIAGDVAAGTNVTLTNSYGLWNAGKTRLDGKTIVNIGNSTMTIGTNTLSDPAFIIDYTGGTPNRDFTINTGGVVRWVMRGDSTAESGSNAGTNFAIRAYDDSGNGIDNPLTIIRAANGLMTLTRPLSVTAGSITGGAGNMTITAGTGNSRTMALQTTTSGGTATTALTLSATQTATFAQTVATRSPTGGTSAAWALGTVAVVSPTSPNRTIEVEIGGTTYYIAAKTTNN